MNEDYENLRKEVLTCTRCGLCATRKNAVFGVGQPSSRVVFVGEAPGENEDIQGEPFVGRGGQLLDRMLQHVGLSRSKNIYITNIVKCRPPDNRNPTPEETAACVGYLRAQLAMIKPEVIVCLGRVSACSLISPDFKVTKQHGEFFERDGALVMGTFHPAALLRNPNYKPPCLEDFIALSKKLGEFKDDGGTQSAF